MFKKLIALFLFLPTICLADSSLVYVTWNSPIPGTPEITLTGPVGTIKGLESVYIDKDNFTQVCRMLEVSCKISANIYYQGKPYNVFNMTIVRADKNPPTYYITNFELLDPMFPTVLYGNTIVISDPN